MELFTPMMRPFESLLKTVGEDGRVLESTLVEDDDEEEEEEECEHVGVVSKERVALLSKGWIIFRTFRL